MKHFLEKIEVENFRSIIKSSFELSEYTALIGYNNAGKSNLLEAIKWLLRKSSLADNDFYDNKKPIVIQGTISGITEDYIAKLDSKHQKSIEPYISNYSIRIKRIQEKPGDSTAKISLFVFDPNATDRTKEWTLNPTGIDNAINSLFPEPIQIKAMENSEEDISKSKSGTTIGKLINEIISPIEEKYGGTIKEQMKGLKKILEADGDERAQELKDFDEQANKKLEDLFPSVKIKIHVPAPELKELFKSGTIKVYEDGMDNGKDISALGTGAQRSIQIALIRYLAEIKKGQDTATRTLLLIDEPELYLHPQAIEQLRYALKILTNQGYQIIFATHSSHFITSKDTNNALLIRKTKELGTYARKRLKDAIKNTLPDALSQIELMFALSNSSQILFSEKVILTEGDTEQRLFPTLYEKIENSTLGMNKIALIRQGGVSNTKKSLDVIKAMDIPVKAIVDLDYVFVNAIKDGFLAQNDKDIEKCKEFFKKLELDNRVKLNNGLPCKGSELTASEAYSLLGSTAEYKTHIDSLYDKMIEKGIWLWRKGAIEEYLGIDGKKEKNWAEYSERLESNDISGVVKDLEEIKGLIKWINK